MNDLVKMRTDEAGSARRTLKRDTRGLSLGDRAAQSDTLKSALEAHTKQTRPASLLMTDGFCHEGSGRGL